jgi:hypothetical protein
LLNHHLFVYLFLRIFPPCPVSTTLRKFKNTSTDLKDQKDLKKMQSTTDATSTNNDKNKKKFSNLPSSSRDPDLKFQWDSPTFPTRKNPTTNTARSDLVTNRDVPMTNEFFCPPSTRTTIRNEDQLSEATTETETHGIFSDPIDFLITFGTFTPTKFKKCTLKTSKTKHGA